MTGRPGIAIVKLGGDVVADPEALAHVLADIASLTASGWRIGVCHGGGPQAGKAAARLDLPVVKVGGRRVTDAATLQVTKWVLAGEVNVDLVAAGLRAGVRAVGLSGVSDGLVTAHRRPPKVVSGGEAPVDFGFVGQIDRIRPDVIRHLWDGGFVPILNTLGVDGAEHRQVYNINADTVASAIAGALPADHLVSFTRIGGVRTDVADPDSRIPRLTASAARAAIADGTIAGGMIPKIEEALKNLARGIGAVHVLGPGPGVLAAAVRQPGQRGTAVVPDATAD